MGFPRQEYWSGLLFPSPGDLSDPGIDSVPPVLQVASCFAARLFTDQATREAQVSTSLYQLLLGSIIC